MTDERHDTVILLKAIEFAARKHSTQRRKGADSSPYINHPIAVAHLVADTGGVTDVRVLVAAVLHDTIEDTETTRAELEANFGSTVRKIVEEMTDDKDLPKQKRKDLQVEHAPRLSLAAKTVKIADKIANLQDVLDCPPATWSDERRREYLRWTESSSRVAAAQILRWRRPTTRWWLADGFSSGVPSWADALTECVRCGMHRQKHYRKTFGLAGSHDHAGTTPAPEI